MRLAHDRAAAALTLAFATTAAAAPQAKPAPRTDAAGGIQWTVPSRWTSGAGSSMRVATYSVPGPKSASAGECAVFFFGAGQGGSVDDNVARWAKLEGVEPIEWPTRTDPCSRCEKCGGPMRHVPPADTS